MPDLDKKEVKNMLNRKIEDCDSCISGPPLSNVNDEPDVVP